MLLIVISLPSMVVMVSLSGKALENDNRDSTSKNWLETTQGLAKFELPPFIRVIASHARRQHACFYKKKGDCRGF